MKSYESTGRTVEEAISAGLSEHGLSIGDVNVEILEEGSKGLFGLFGSRQARVRLTINEMDVQSATRDIFKDSLSEEPQRGARRQAKEMAPREQAPRPERKPAEKAEKPEKEEAPAEKKPTRARKPRQRAPKAERVDAKETRTAPAPREHVPVEPAVQADRALPEGQAQEFLQELTGLMGLSIAVSVRTDADGHVFARLDGDPQGILIGRRGETLDALQYLTSLKVNRGREEYVRVTLDSEGYRERREEALVRLANRMANRARKTGRRVSMEPMNPYERRIFHSALQATPGIATHSEGEDPNRHVVITPVKVEEADSSAE